MVCARLPTGGDIVQALFMRFIDDTLLRAGVGILPSPPASHSGTYSEAQSQS